MIKILWEYEEYRTSKLVLNWKEKNRPFIRVLVCAFGENAVYYKDEYLKEKVAVCLYHPSLGKSYLHRFMLEYPITEEIRNQIINLLDIK